MDEQQHVEVLNATAPDFFGWVQKMASDATFLGIARLTDNATTGRKQANASLRRLLDETGWQTSDPATWQRYDAKLKRVVAACDACRLYRHKQLGHFDLAVALKAEAVPVVTVREIDTALDAIEEFVGDIFTQLRPGQSQSFRFLNGDDHVDRLFKQLTNRASRRRANAVSRIIKTDEGAVLLCGFCDTCAPVWMLEDDVPEGRHLKHWHFRECPGVIGIEEVTVEMTDSGGNLRARKFRLTDGA